MQTIDAELTVPDLLLCSYLFFYFLAIFNTSFVLQLFLDVELQ